MKKITLSKHLLALACLSTLGVSAQAQTAPAEPESTLAFNAGVVSEYRYRGISQFLRGRLGQHHQMDQGQRQWRDRPR